jgi:ABC-2 type transport system permease protein
MSTTARVYWLETRNEFLKLARMRAYVLSTLLFPLMFYCFFGLLMGDHRPGPMSLTRYLLATYGAFGVMGATLFAFGVGVAVERGMGWLEVKRASPMPAAAYFFAKAAVGLAFGAIVVMLLFTLGAVAGGVRMPFDRWLLSGVALVVGSIPFCALGLVIGSLSGPNSAAPTVNAIYLPLGFCSGLWIPYDFLPRGLQQVANVLPSYHLGALALGIQRGAGGEALTHTAVLAAWSAIFIGAAWILHARMQAKLYG